MKERDVFEHQLKEKIENYEKQLDSQAKIKTLLNARCDTFEAALTESESNFYSTNNQQDAMTPEETNP